MRWNQSISLVAAGLLCLVGGEAMGQEKGSAGKVKVNVTAEKPASDGKQTILIDLDIEKDWHAYANPVGVSELEGSATQVEVVGQAGAKVEYPKGKFTKDPVVGDYFTYEGKVQIKATVDRKNNPGPVNLKIKFMTCNDKGQCLLPAKIEKKVD